MTADQISEMRHASDRLGHLYIGSDGSMIIEAVAKEQMTLGEAQNEIVQIMNSLRPLLEEVARLAEDHARMTNALREINAKVVDAMQGTSRSEIADDWWQAACG